MKSFNKLRSTVFLFSVVALLLSTGLYVYMYAQSGRMVELVIESYKKVSAGNAAKAQSKDILKLYQDTADDRAMIRTFLVPKDNAVTFIKTVEDLGASSGAVVSISGIRSENPGDDAKVKIGHVSASVTAKGTWSQVMKTLELFEAFPYIAMINNVDLKLEEVLAGDGKEKEIRKWQLTFHINADTI